MTARLRNALLAAMIAWLGFTVIACSGSKLDGKWANSNGTVMLEFSSGRAYLSMGELTAEGAYQIEGDKIIIDSEGDKFVLTRNPDGSLSGPGDNMSGRLIKLGK
ncbi:MAG: hypothetical protein LAN63_02450 [Acidobacteriia bacterium]|nr:hypothetical protein [Terriglobia bacterium]